MAIANGAPMGPTSRSGRCARPRTGFCGPRKEQCSAMPDAASELRVKIFADGADRASILELACNPLIQGFTTNPTLMRKAGIVDYEAFGRELARVVPDRPFSFEVLSDDFEEMEAQALN